MQDLSNYNKNAVIIAKKYFSVSDIDDYYKKADAKPLIFCHFARGLGEKVYNEVTEFRDLYKTLTEVRRFYSGIMLCFLSKFVRENPLWHLLTDMLHERMLTSNDMQPRGSLLAPYTAT